jgi:hypothetical protein
MEHFLELKGKTIADVLYQENDVGDKYLTLIFTDGTTYSICPYINGSNIDNCWVSLELQKG